MKNKRKEKQRNKLMRQFKGTSFHSIFKLKMYSMLFFSIFCIVSTLREERRLVYVFIFFPVLLSLSVRCHISLVLNNFFHRSL